MDLQVLEEKGKIFVVDKATGEKLNKGKPFPDRAAALSFMKAQSGAEKLGAAGDKLMPKPPAGPPVPGGMPGGMPDLAAMMGGKPPMPGMPPMGKKPMMPPGMGM